MRSSHNESSYLHMALFKSVELLCTEYSYKPALKVNIQTGDNSRSSGQLPRATSHFLLHQAPLDLPIRSRLGEFAPFQKSRIWQFSSSDSPPQLGVLCGGGDQLHGAPGAPDGPQTVIITHDSRISVGRPSVVAQKGLQQYCLP